MARLAGPCERAGSARATTPGRSPHWAAKPNPSRAEPAPVTNNTQFTGRTHTENNRFRRGKSEPWSPALAPLVLAHSRAAAANAVPEALLALEDGGAPTGFGRLHFLPLESCSWGF